MIAKRARRPALKAKSKAARTAKAAKAAKSRTVRIFEPKLKFEPEFPQTFSSQGEQAWLKLTRADHDDDRWGQVEEHLLGQAQGKEHSLRRWKYFAH